MSAKLCEHSARDFVVPHLIGSVTATVLDVEVAAPLPGIARQQVSPPNCIQRHYASEFATEVLLAGRSSAFSRSMPRSSQSLSYLDIRSQAVVPPTADADDDTVHTSLTLERQRRTTHSLQ